MLRGSLIFLLILAFSVGTFSQNRKRSYYYVIQADDNLSKILFKANIKPIYGPYGKLKSLKQFNQPPLKDIETVTPGQKIKIPDELVIEALASKTIEIKTTDQIVFTQTSLVPPAIEERKEEISLKTTEEDNFESHLMIALQADYLSLSGTEIANNSRAKLLSDLNTAWLLSWIHHWSSDTSSRIMFSQKQVSITPESHTIPLHNTTLSLFSFGVGYSKKINADWTFQGTLKYSQQLFYRGYLGTGGGLEINKIPITQINPEVTYYLINRKKVSLLLQAGASYYTPSSYDNYQIDAGYGYNTLLQIQQVLKSNNILFCGIFFEQRNQPTSLVQISQQNIGANCGFEWGLE